MIYLFSVWIIGIIFLKLKLKNAISNENIVLTEEELRLLELTNEELEKLEIVKEHQVLMAMFLEDIKR